MTECVVFVSDDHAPYTDGDTFRTRLAAIKFLKPNVVVLGGDHVDFYQLSRFDKSPERIPQLQDDIDAAYMLLKAYRKAAPGAKMVYLQGNHEERLQHYIHTHAPALFGLRGLSVPKLLSLPDLGIQWEESGVWEYKGFVYKHGTTVRNKSSYSAAGEMDRFWASGMSGHTHRLGLHYKTSYKGTTKWIEAGCGCLPLDYIKQGPADWQQGFAYNISNGKHWFPQPVEIVKGMCMIHGQEVSF